MLKFENKLSSLHLNCNRICTNTFDWREPIYVQKYWLKWLFFCKVKHIVNHFLGHVRRLQDAIKRLRNPTHGKNKNGVNKKKNDTYYSTCFFLDLNFITCFEYFTFQTREWSPNLRKKSVRLSYMILGVLTRRRTNSGRTSSGHVWNQLLTHSDLRRS